MKRKKNKPRKHKNYIVPIPKKKKNPVMRIFIIVLASAVMLGAILMPLAQVLSGH